MSAPTPASEPKEQRDPRNGGGTGASSPRGPVRASERALAPDLARGAMLLLIVLSNTAFHLWAAEHGPSGWHPVDGTPLDGAVQFAMITALDLRAYPLFAFLFGYGMMRLYERQVAHGASDRSASLLLTRRSLWMVAFGAVHASLLMAGDIVGAYGVTGVALAWLLMRRSDRVLLGVAVVLALIAAVPAVQGLWTVASQGLTGITAAVPPEAPSTHFYAAGEADWAAAARMRITTWLFVTAAGSLLGVTSVAAMAVGMWAARRRVLEEPGRHLRLLRWTAAVGVPVGWLGGLPSALVHVGVLEAAPAAVAEDGPLPALQSATGLVCGLGYAALFTLLALRIATRGRPGRAAGAVAALGKRSLSGYMAHSLLFAPVLAAWGLGLGAHLGSASMALFAVAVWLVTVGAAYGLDRAGRPGPAEALLRRLTYGRRLRTGAQGRV